MCSFEYTTARLHAMSRGETEADPEPGGLAGGERRRFERQARAMDASLTGIALLDDDGVYTYMNDAHAGIFDREPSELLGEAWRQLYDEDRVEEIESVVFPELEETGSWAGELVGRRADGTAVPQHVELTALEDGLICVNRDVTDRRQRRDRLVAIRDRVESLMLADDTETVVSELLAVVDEVVERSLAGFWRYDKATDRLCPVEISPATTELPVEIPTFERDEGLVWRAFEEAELQYHPDLAGAEGTYADETVLGSEVAVPAGDHGVLLVGSERVDDFDADERELLRIVTGHVDTGLQLLSREAELEQTRRRLSEERRQLREVIDYIPHLVFARDEAGEFVMANEAVAEVYDSSVSELEGSTDADFSPKPDEPAAFHADDSQVLESGEAIHRPRETVTDAHGDERVLDTWKVPFVPADDEKPAVLSVATDVTDHRETQTALRRQRRLAALERVGRLLLSADTEEAVYGTAAAATAEALDADTVTVYRFRASERRLVPVDTTGEAEPTPVTPGDDPLWRAFGGRETTTGGETEGGDGEVERATGETTEELDSGPVPVTATPLDEYGLLVVEGYDRVDGDVQFVETAARTVTAALRRTEQEDRLERLNEELRETNVRLRSNERVAVAFRRVQRRLREAMTPERVFDVLVEFAATVGDDAWASEWHSGPGRLEPTAVVHDGGPARTETGQTPGTAAARRDEPVTVDSTARDTTYADWSARLLTFGFQSTVAVPVAADGLVRGCLSVVAESTAAFDGELRTYLTEAARTAGARLADVTDGSGETTVVADLQWVDERPFVPVLPEEVSLTVTDLTPADDGGVVVEGTVTGPAGESLRATPGVADLTVFDGDGGGPFRAKLMPAGDRDPGRFLTVVRRHDAVVSRVEIDTTESTVTVRVDGDRLATLRSELSTVAADCRLVAKRPAGETGESSTALLSALTDRQREVLSTAFAGGYYDRPKGITGDGLADRLDVSRSTVHQHLRTAEQKLLARLFDPVD